MSRTILFVTTLLYQFASHAGCRAAPEAVLPEGLELITAAKAPLVTHPLMGCIDPGGALYVGDAAGLNLNKPELEAQLPNRILRLVDENGDGVYDRSTVFADKMTFPQGACWFQGALYVASPPGIWKLVDGDGDGVAEDRAMIVGGFDYTGNAADVHGPFIHPNGRLYWCHGRKGHRVVQQPGGKLVHEGLASGIWSCLPDGADVQWHSLACADNPVEVDFTPSGDIIGTCNLYYSQPRGDTLMHWLAGGVYERPDMMKALDGLPRTLEHMPVMYNYGHVAVSGCTFYRGETLLAPTSKLQMFVTHFNTQRLVRMELEPEGSTYKATEHEFLQLRDPDIHLTDVIEDRDGSLILLDTGGWFRIGCPSSLMAKPEIAGGVYRVRRRGGAPPLVEADPSPPAPAPPPAGSLADQIRSSNPAIVRRACEAAGGDGAAGPALLSAVQELFGRELDPALEHAVVHAALGLRRRTGSPGPPLVAGVPDLELKRRLLVEGQLLVEAGDTAAPEAVRAILASLEGAEPGGRAMEAGLFVLNRLPGAVEALEPVFEGWLEAPLVTPQRLALMEPLLRTQSSSQAAERCIGRMLEHGSWSVQESAMRIIAGKTAAARNEAWLAVLQKRLEETSGPGLEPRRLQVVIDAAARFEDPRFDDLLRRSAENAALPPTLRLKALTAVTASAAGFPEASFAFLQKLALDPGGAAARLEAVRVLARTRLSGAQLEQLLGSLPLFGPLELGELLKGLKKYGKPEEGRLIALAMARSPVLGSIQESTIRTLFSGWPAGVYDLIEPSLQEARESVDAKKRRLEELARLAETSGNAAEGRRHFESGRGSCMACHRVGEVGRALGPDLSRIGSIRRERDLMESILFPSATLARDYEMHTIEMKDGQSVTGLIKSHTAEGILLVDPAGQERNIPHESIVARLALTTSLMPMGLEQTMTPQELCDLVAWLRSLK